MRSTARSVGSVFAMLVFGALSLSTHGDEPAPRFIGNGQAHGRIVLAAGDATTVEAGERLQALLLDATGVTVPLAPTPGESPGLEIRLGWSDDAKAAAPGLAPDGFVWKTLEDGSLVIGGPGKGTLYGTTAFLEEHLGIRFYTPALMHVPKSEVVDLPRLDEVRRPAFPVRWVHMPAAEDQAWCDWHGVHSRAHRDASWGMFVHTFHDLVHPGRYFEKHPEYFSEIKGKRLPSMQLCLTNENVLRIVVSRLRRRMWARPDAKLWSVSQNDRHGACECEKCRALVEKHGSEAGPLIAFVNRVAKAIPDKTISTLAYTYTRRAPRGLALEPNVNVVLCSIECDRAQPLAGSERNADFVRDLREWSALTKNLMIWDYVVQFSNYVSPFPNFHVLQPNIQLFRDHGVQLMFQQGSGSSKSDLSELKQYVIAKLLWDPDRDVDALIDDFLAGVYGTAAPHVRRYLDLLHRKLQSSGAGLSIYGSPVVQGETWLAPQTLDEAEAILAEAKEAVAEEPELLKRVERIGLSVIYARLEQAKRYGSGPYGAFDPTEDGGWWVKQRWVDAVDALVEGCRESGIENVHERSSPPEDYAVRTWQFFAEGMTSHLAMRKPVELAAPHSPRYPADGVATLVDGLRGTTDYHYNWLGWEATDLVATVDLGEIRTVSHVAADFLQVVGSWIWLPVEVRWSTSTDGTTWIAAKPLEPRASARRSDPFTERFESRFPPRPARYVRLEADSITHCPDWHQGAGGDAWIFCDEIVVLP